MFICHQDTWYSSHKKSTSRQISLLWQVRSYWGMVVHFRVYIFSRISVFVLMHFDTLKLEYTPLRCILSRLVKWNYLKSTINLYIYQILECHSRTLNKSTRIWYKVFVFISSKAKFSSWWPFLEMSIFSKKIPLVVKGNGHIDLWFVIISQTILPYKCNACVFPWYRARYYVCFFQEA